MFLRAKACPEPAEGDPGEPRDVSRFLRHNSRAFGSLPYRCATMKDFYTWSAIFAIVFASVVGDVLLSHAMKQVGDVGALRRRAGLATVIGRTLSNPNFFFALASMAVAFFSLLFALSWGDVSLVAPAAASLTFIANAFAAKIFLHERVDRRRWIAASLVAAGVALLAG
jgi:drug/metabolite transporter (DMT)-like permease